MHFLRFARNRVDSIMYKAQLKKYGIRVVSATEPVSNDESGEFYEMFFEWNDKSICNAFQNEYTTDLTRALKTALIAAGNSYGYKLIDTDKRGNKGIIHLSPLVPKAGLVRRDALRKRAGGTFLAKAAKQFIIASGGRRVKKMCRRHVFS